MLILILLLIAGTGLVYVSKYNFAPVTLNFGRYILPDVPLFYVIAGSVIFGLTLSYLFYLIHLISTSLKLRGKNNEIKKDKDEILELTKRVHQLELEKEKMKNGKKYEPSDENAL